MKFMIFHHPQRKIEHLVPALELNSEPLEHVSEFNFLGLTLDEHISWKPHVQKIAKITRGQYWPPGIVVACVRPSVRLWPSLSAR